MAGYGVAMTCLGEDTDRAALNIEAADLQAEIALDDIRHAWADSLAELLR